MRLSAASLTMSLAATNTGPAAFDFQALVVNPNPNPNPNPHPHPHPGQALLHPYFRVEDVTGVVVLPCYP